MNNLNFKDLVAKVKGLPTRTKNIIFLIIGIFVFIISYTMGFQKIQEKTAAVQAEVETQSSYVKELKDYQANLPVYEKGIQESKDFINENLSHLPAGISTEEMLMYIKEANEAVNANLANVSIKDPVSIGEFSCVAGDKGVQMTGMQVDASFSTEMRYKEFKDLLDYIYATNEITILDDVSLSFNPESATLATDCDISKFYVTYDGSEYIPAQLPDVKTGNENPFGTGSNS